MGDVRIASYWELGWNTPILEISLWEFPLKDFGVEKDHLYMSPISGINHKVNERENLEEILKENEDYTKVFCDERANCSLLNFEHPKKALYIFGRTNFSPFLSLKKENDLSVSIETCGSTGMAWGHQAASIVLYDRMIKIGN